MENKDIVLEENKEEKTTVSKNFIEMIIDKDLAEGTYDHVQTRFPPEPKWLSAHWTCKVYFIEQWTGKGI